MGNIKIIISAVLLAFALNTSAAVKISEIEFSETRLGDVVRVLSELSQSNIIATPSAINKSITIHLKNVSEVDAIKSICRISDLWYRYDEDTHTYRIMGREEYTRDLVVRESQRIEVFRLRNANVQIVAQAIEDLYGDRVELSLGIEAGQSTSSRSGSRSNSTSSRSSSRSSNNSSQRYGSNGNADTSEFSVAQIEQLTRVNSSNSVMPLDPNKIQAVTLQPQPIYITVNNEHNMIIARTDDDKVLASISSLVKQMDIPVPQVMLEMKILSISLGEDFNSIFNFELAPFGSNDSLTPTSFGNNGLLNSGSFLYEYLNDRLRANIEFLEENKRLKVLSNPMVLASNHREADLFIGEESLMTRGFTFNPATIDSGVVISPAYIETQTELREIGISLKITPRINSDGSVLLDLEQESSTLNPGGGTVPVTDGTGNVVNLSIDTINTSRLRGVVAAQNGLTVAVGGLIRSTVSNNERKVPLLGDVPVLGAAFRSTIEEEEETEMVLLITPRILNTPSSSQELERSNNRFYQQYNQGFPDLEKPEPRFFKEENKAWNSRAQQPEVKPVQPLPSKSSKGTSATQEWWDAADEVMFDAG
ncbi:type II secretion system protein GspD [Neptuniibacter marinus]|uniref:type II secretion system protein GspD n=1 Tax=Neptuniibacter marinus TaxID=1806670 RepID=UPI00082D9301|nr:type II secretion system protein GspD [Neptuniibacter marinus]